MGRGGREVGRLARIFLDVVEMRVAVSDRIAVEHDLVVALEECCVLSELVADRLVRSVDSVGMGFD